MGRSILRLAVIAVLLGVSVAAALSPPPPRDVMKVTCTATGTEVGQPNTIPQRDGVQVSVVNATGRAMTFVHSGGGFGVSAKGATAVLDLPPGLTTVVCIDPLDPAQDGPSSPAYLARRASFVVADVPFWKPFTPECGTAGLRGVITDGGAPTPGSQLTLQAMLSVRGLKASDVVERAGYPAGPAVHMRTIRDGRVIAVTNFGRGGSGFYSNGVLQCVDTLPARILASTRVSPRGAAFAFLDGEALTVTPFPAMRPGLRGRLNQSFRVRCALGRRVLVGTGRFLLGASQALVFLSERSVNGPASGECLLYSGASRLVALKGFRPAA